MAQEQELRQRMSERSDDDLLRIVTVDSAEYTAEALEFARAELRGRNYVEAGTRWLRSDEARGPEADLARLEQRVASLEARLPKTDVLSSKFWPRAFAVYGHALAAHAIVMTVLMGAAGLFAVVQALLK